MLHELVHVTLAAANQEGPASRENRPAAEWARIERYAEEVASAVIIPEETLRSMLSRVTVARDAWTISDVRSLASRFRVTPLAMATRLRKAGQLTWAGYERWRKGWFEYLATLPARSGGFASPIDKSLNRAGRPFAQLVVEAMDASRITAAQASHYLDLRFHHVEGLRAELREFATSGTEVGGEG